MRPVESSPASPIESSPAAWAVQSLAKACAALGDAPADGSRQLEVERWSAEFASAASADMPAALEAASRTVAAHALAACALSVAALDAKQAKAVADWALETLVQPADALRMEKVLRKILPRWDAGPMFGARSIEDPVRRVWAQAQAALPPNSSVALFKNGVGLHGASDAEWGQALRGADLEGSRLLPDRSRLALWLRSGCLDASMRGCGAKGLFQALLRKARDPELMDLAARAQAKAGFVAGEAFEGQHPLWRACEQWRGREFDAECSKAMASMMRMGFGPNMELPASMSLTLSRTQRANNAPSMPLEWAKRSDRGIQGAAELANGFGVDLEARNAAGETLLGVLNRLAKRPGSAASAEAQFIQLAALGADPLALAPSKSMESLAANPSALRAAAAAKERRALALAMDESVLARARELMGQAKAVQASSHAAKAKPRL